MSFLIMGAYIDKYEVFHFPKGVKPMSERDIQFQGFAKLLCEEIDRATDEMYNVANDKGIFPLMRDIYASEQHEKDIQTLIARRAYDLVKHALNDIQYDSEKYIDSHVRKISDMTELPEEENVD